MDNKKPVIGLAAIAVGAAALLLAIVHFWAGPFSPQPTIESTIADKAVAIRDATVAALKGEEVVEKKQERWNLDRIAQIATGVMAGLAIVLSVVSFAMHEPIRVGVGGVILGGTALAFQIAMLAIGAIVIALLVAAVLGELSFD